MFEACECGKGGKNTGQPSCVPTIKRSAKLVFMQTIADDGTFNRIESSDFVNGKLPNTYIESKINEADPSKRTFLGTFYDKVGSPQFAGVMNSFQCISVSYFEISVDGDIVGIDNNTEMLPIAVETGTLYAGVVRGTKTDLNGVSLTFSVNELVRDENLIQIGSSSIDTNMILKRGLIDVVGSALTSPVITATTVRLNLDFIYGDFPNKLAFEGLTAGDLSYDSGVTPSTVFNSTQSSSVAVASITPVLGSKGVYDVVIASGAISADDILVSLSKNGYQMEAFSYLIP